MMLTPGPVDILDRIRRKCQTHTFHWDPYDSRFWLGILVSWFKKGSLYASDPDGRHDLTIANQAGNSC